MRFTVDSEAENLAMGDGVKEALFVNGMLQFLRPSRKPRKTDVLEDNEGAIVLADNPLSSSRSKHIDVRHHFLRNLTEEGVIEVTHVPSEKQHADILMKALPRDLSEFTATLHLARGMRNRSLSRTLFCLFSLIYIFGLVDTTAPREGDRGSSRVYRLSCGRTSDWMI